MQFVPSNFRNGKVMTVHRPQTLMKGGIIAGDIDLARNSAGYNRKERNSKLQSIGSSISKINEKMKEKQNLVF